MEVRAKDKDDLFVASCRWFEEEKVLTSDDVQFIKEARKQRGQPSSRDAERSTSFWRAGGYPRIEAHLRISLPHRRVWLVSVDDAPAGSQSIGAILLRYFTEVVIEDGRGTVPPVRH